MKINDKLIAAANAVMAEVLREAANIVEETGAAQITIAEAIDQAIMRLAALDPSDFETEH